VPGVEGPYGTKVPMIAPYNMAPPGSQHAAMAMMSQNMPLNMMQMNQMGGPMGGPPGSAMPNPMAPGGMLLSPPGMPPMPGMSPPPGMPSMPGMPPGGPGGPGGNPFMKTSMQGMMPDAGMMNANLPPSVRQPGGVLPAQFASSSPVGSMFPAQRTQVYFGNPVRMKVYWYTQGADGKPNYSTTPLETPGRYNFAQGAIYRLKLTNIPGRPALELYPTLEVVPTSPKTNEFLAHNSVPVDFSEDDFKQVVDRNYIVKVIYLPDPQFQDAAGAGPGEITSAQLEPGQDPIQEALRRGSILLVMRIGNIDQGLVSSPPTNAPVPGGPPMMMKPPFMGTPPGVQIPFNMAPITPGMPGGFAPGMMPPGGFPPGMMPPGGFPPGMVPPGAIPPGGFPPGMIPPGAIPPGAVPPGGLGVNPSPLPPLGPGGPPPLNKVPEPPVPGPGNPFNLNKGPLVPPPPFEKPEDAAKPLNFPAVPLTPPNAGSNTEKLTVPPTPLPMSEEKGTNKSSVAPLLPAVTPASTTKDVDAPAANPLTLPPALPPAAERPGLPMVPMPADWPERK